MNRGFMIARFGLLQPLHIDGAMGRGDLRMELLEPVLAWAELNFLKSWLDGYHASGVLLEQERRRQGERMAEAACAVVG